MGPTGPNRDLDVDETGRVIVGQPCFLQGWYVFNAHASALRYLKFYDKATAPTSGDTPVLTLPLPAANGANMLVPKLGFLNGLSLRATTGIADNDTGAPGTNEVIVNLFTTLRP